MRETLFSRFQDILLLPFCWNTRIIYPKTILQHLKRLPGLLWVLAPKKIYPTAPSLFERCKYPSIGTPSGLSRQIHANMCVLTSLSWDSFCAIQIDPCRYVPSNPYKTIKRSNMRRPWAAREYLPASQLLFLLFFLEQGACNFDSWQTGNHNLVSVSWSRYPKWQGHFREHKNTIFTISGHPSTVHIKA